MSLDIGITDKDRNATIKLLQTLLADESILFLKTRDAHWNVTGPHFNHLHAFFESQYEGLAESLDEIAERIRKLDGHATATMVEYLKLTRLKEEPGTAKSADGYLKTLLADHETLIRHLRTEIEIVGPKYGDSGTQDFLTGLLQDHEKTAWMIRASLKG